MVISVGNPTGVAVPVAPLVPSRAALDVPGKWVIECADCPKQFTEMSNRSLRLDADGHPHIAYGEDHLYYAWYDGADWHYETADAAPNVGAHAALALDGSGYPLNASNIIEFAQIVSIIDCYEALTNDDRLYRKSMAPIKALELIQSEIVNTGKFSKELFKNFAHLLLLFYN